jgi:hypothetical protein
MPISKSTLLGGLTSVTMMLWLGGSFLAVCICLSFESHMEIMGPNHLLDSNLFLETTEKRKKETNPYHIQGTIC